MLGHVSATAVRDEAFFGQGSGEIILDDVNCEGTESKILQCEHIGQKEQNCDRSEAAGVICLAGIGVFRFFPSNINSIPLLNQLNWLFYFL